MQESHVFHMSNPPEPLMGKAGTEGISEVIRKANNSLPSSSGRDQRRAALCKDRAEKPGGAGGGGQETLQELSWDEEVGKAHTGIGIGIGTGAQS